MNIILWLVLILMTMIALIIVLIPLLHHRTRKNINTRKAKYTAFLVVILLPLFTFTIYHFAGESALLQQYWLLKKESSIVRKELSRIKNPNQIVLRLQHFLMHHPNHPKGWYLLGRLYLGMKAYEKSELALRKAYGLNPNNTDYAIAYAEALFFENHQRLSPKAKKIIYQVVQQQPSNVSAINLLAINAYLQKDYHQAIHYWQHLLTVLPPNTKDSKMLLSMIKRAQDKLLHQSS